MPYFAPTAPLVARAVRSILSQTHKDLRLVVVNDGGPKEVWKPLARFRDDRLVRFDLPVNRGRYYADAVTLAACDSEWWSPHDSDDWSERGRFAALLAHSQGCDVVLGGWTTRQSSGREVVKHPKFAPDDGRLRYQANHVGLWRVEALRSIGGPHPDWRIAYDTLQVGLATRYLDVRTCPDVGYHHEVRPGSLSSSRETGIGSAERAAVHRKRQRLWMGSRTMSVEGVRALLAPSARTVEALAVDTERLRGLL